MPSIRTLSYLLVSCALGTDSNAQSITNVIPPVIGFVDISTFGINLTNLFSGSDGVITAVSSIGNGLFPAGNIRLGNDGVAVAGINTGTCNPINVAIPATGDPAGLPSGNGTICAFWDDLNRSLTGTFPTSIWGIEQSGVLYLMWKNEYHTPDSTPGQTITFEIQVFSTPAPDGPWIQILYPDVTFGGTAAAFNNGASATIGYVKGTNPLGNNVQWSHNTASVTSGTVLSIYFSQPVVLTASSPLGPGSLEIVIGNGPPNGTYFLAATLMPGAFPNGWLFGLDISYTELTAQLAAGFPFTGTLNASGSFSLGVFQGLPTGFTIYSIAFGLFPGAAVPTTHSPAMSYAIP